MSTKCPPKPQLYFYKPFIYVWSTKIMLFTSLHYVYSNMFDIAEFLTQNNHGPI